MIWILFALLVAAAWALWFILQWNIIIPIIITITLGVVAFVVFIWRTVKARRSASALERAIAEQGKQQAMSARPERRAEIQALQKQILDGIQALKQSKLGGKKRGGGALYSLPWYAIIGPPGAGKTTALKHSGLVFPYADTSVRGVGGTRNCDWWFTNEAILLDTAGRYTTEQEDQQEWLAFLGMLSKHRSNKPLNGLIVAVSATDIIDANEQQLEIMGKRLRARIDEVMTKLRMVLPVYLLITKCDLVAGFVEFFGDLRKSDRGQAWGATIPLKADKSKPGEIFANEFDTLVQETFNRGIKRLAQERNRAARERIYQFPLEFAGFKRNLTDLIGQTFMVNAFQGTPTFRGFYFTSGTQEGTPMARVLGRMGQAMGIRPPQTGAQQQVESKSYFLHDVFTNIVFPDATVAGRSQSELRRQRIVRLAVAAAALGVAVLFAIPSILSFFNNKKYLQSTKELCEKAATIKWDTDQLEPVENGIEAIEPLIGRLKELQEHAGSAPLDKSFLMYSGDAVYKPALTVFLWRFQAGFVEDSRLALGLQLAAARGGDSYVDERLALKTYLMLHQPENLDVDWATGEFTALWANARKDKGSKKTAHELREMMRGPIEYYLGLLKEGHVNPVTMDDGVVAKARKVLQAEPPVKRYYRLFVDIITHQKIDPKGDLDTTNMVFPPVSMRDAIDTQTRWDELKKFIRSKVNIEEQKKNPKSEKVFDVRGPYTTAGRVAVFSNIKDAAEILKSEEWVVPLTDDEKSGRLEEHLLEVRRQYEQNYIDAWKGFLLDISVEAPASLERAKEFYSLLSENPKPYLEFIRLVNDNTQWKNAADNKGVQAASSKLSRFAATKAKQLTRFDVNVDIGTALKNQASKVPVTFKYVVQLGLGTPGAQQTAITQYADLVANLRSLIVKRTAEDPATTVKDLAGELESRIADAAALVQGTDDFTKLVFIPLVQIPLNVNGQFKMTNPAIIPAGN